MAYLVVVITAPETIANLNSKIQESGKPHESVNNLANYCNAMLAGASDALVQITVRDTDPSVSTSGSGSTQESYDLR